MYVCCLSVSDDRLVRISLRIRSYGNVEIGSWIISLGFIKSRRSMFQWRAEKEIIFASCLGMNRMIL